MCNSLTIMISAILVWIYYEIIFWCQNSNLYDYWKNEFILPTIRNMITQNFFQMGSNMSHSYLHLPQNSVSKLYKSIPENGHCWLLIVSRYMPLNVQLSTCKFHLYKSTYSVNTASSTNLLWPVQEHLNNKIPSFFMIEEDKQAPVNKPCPLM